jgi:hypothetical protein
MLVILVAGALIFTLVDISSLLPPKIELNNNMVGDETFSVAYATNSANPDEKGKVHITFTYFGSKKITISPQNSKLTLDDGRICQGYEIINHDLDNIKVTGSDEILFLQGYLGTLSFNCSNLTILEEEVLQGNLKFFIKNRKTGVPTPIKGNLRLKVTKNDGIGSDRKGWMFGEIPLLYLPLKNDAKDYSNHNYAISNFGATFDGTCGDFDGINDGISINTTLEPQSFTYSGWFAFQTTSVGVLISVADGTTYGADKALMYYSGSGLGSILDKTLEATYTWTPTLNQWYHLVSTVDSSTKENVLYIDGVEVDTETYSGIINYNHGNYHAVGFNYEEFNSNPNAYFKGQIKEIIIYDIALNETQVLQLYNNNGEPIQ